MMTAGDSATRTMTGPGTQNSKVDWPLATLKPQSLSRCPSSSQVTVAQPEGSGSGSDSPMLGVYQQRLRALPGEAEGLTEPEVAVEDRVGRRRLPNTHHRLADPVPQRPCLRYVARVPGGASAQLEVDGRRGKGDVLVEGELAAVHEGLD
eukprot:3643767-Rhodomonas_salina.3